MTIRSIFKKKIVIVNYAIDLSQLDKQTVIISIGELKEWLRSGEFLRHIGRYHEAVFTTYRNDLILYPLAVGILLKLMSPFQAYLQDRDDVRLLITWKWLLAKLTAFSVDFFSHFFVLRRAWRTLRQEEYCGIGGARHRPLCLTAPVAYLRTDFWFGVKAGGSIGHINGVLNNLDRFAGKPVLVSTDEIPLVGSDIEKFFPPLGRKFWDFPEILSVHFNEILERYAIDLFRNRNFSFIYQRYSLNNYCGALLAVKLQIPFVLEYNGSEVWVHQSWGKPLRHRKLSERIELFNLKAADLIVVVSDALREELLDGGIEAAKILVNPNGVDPGIFHPAVDGSPVRNKYRLNDSVVVGFIGTFGPWHGIEVLVDAVKPMILQNLKTRFLLIGDGVLMPKIKDTIAREQIQDFVRLTGIIPQDQAPAYLAACDILVSPHVPNPDGTPFFGSPTKLFEYMAMGKGIVASNLEQIGEVLEHGKTAWMVKPGDVASLVAGLKTLINDKGLRDRLGQAARQEVVKKYTWETHTRRIIEKLKNICAEKEEGSHAIR